MVVAAVVEPARMLIKAFPKTTVAEAYAARVKVTIIVIFFSLIRFFFIFASADTPTWAKSMNFAEEGGPNVFRRVKVEGCIGGGA